MSSLAQVTTSERDWALTQHRRASTNPSRPYSDSGYVIAETHSRAAAPGFRTSAVGGYGIVGIGARGMGVLSSTASDYLFGEDACEIVLSTVDLPGNDHRSVIAPHFVSAVSEMNGYGDLRDGWDGYNSVAPAAGVIDNAITFLGGLPWEVRAPEATASADGSVGWFWHTPRGYVSVNFAPSDRFAYYAVAGEREASGASQFVPGAVPQDLLAVIKSV